MSKNTSNTCFDVYKYVMEYPIFINPKHGG